MLIEQLKNNKGTVSSKLGKELANEVLNGKTDMLTEAIDLVSYELDNPKAKSVRAGAAKIVEKVAEKSPELVAPYIAKLFQGFSVPEPQTRWMLMMIYHYCAALNSEDAIKAIDYARDFVHEGAGVCLSGATDKYLGSIGALSKELAAEAYEILLEAYDNAYRNEVDWILEAFIDLCQNLDLAQKDTVKKIATKYQNESRKATVKRVEKLLTLINE